MDLYVVIPLVACIGATAMTSAILARDPSARRSRVAAAILACASLWGLCDLLAHLLASQPAALLLARVALLPIFALAPLALQLLLEERDAIRRRYTGFLILTWGCVIIASGAGLLSPALISNVVWTHWGWIAQHGPFYILGFIPALACAVAAFTVFTARTRLNKQPEHGFGEALAWIATLLLAVIPVTEFLAPLLEIGGPRLGALSVTILGAILWILSLTLGEYAPPPGSFAREMLDSLTEGVALVNRDGRIRAANATLAELALLSPDDLKGGLMCSLLGIATDDLPDESGESETTMRRGDRSSIAISIARSDLTDRNGTKLGSVYVIRDFREVVRLRRQLVAAGRLAAVGELAAGIVHEVNNPIAFIKSNLNSLYSNDASIMEILCSELSREALPESLLEGHHLIGQSLQDISRVASIVKEVRGFSHMGPTGRQVNDVNKLIEDVVRIALPQLRNRATLERRFAELPPIECAGQEIRQIVLDLILNAARSLDGFGTIRLTTRAESNAILLLIEDDGRGHTPDQVEGIFDPTTSRSDQDSGPDLCVAYQIVRQHGGEIHFNSLLGQGTRVSVRLPSIAHLADEAASSATSGEHTTSSPGWVL